MTSSKILKVLMVLCFFTLFSGIFIENSAVARPEVEAIEAEAAADEGLEAAAAIAAAIPSNPCACSTICSLYIKRDHRRLRPDVNEHTSSKFTEHRNWVLNTFFKQQVLPALMLFTEQMSAVAMHQTMVIGQFFDAKQQLETQRVFQELQAEAHKDYQPSEDFCWFGTNVRSLAASEQRARVNAYSLSRRQMARHTLKENMAGANNVEEDKKTRWEVFQKNFCDPKDNNWLESVSGTGLRQVCESTSGGAMANVDIDYTRLVDSQRTIWAEGNGSQFDLQSGLNVQKAEEAVFALGNNLYGHNLIESDVRGQTLKTEDQYAEYMEFRPVMAKRSVAENSYNAIIGMKSAGTTANGVTTADTYKYLGAVLKELGIPEAEIEDMIGKNPSYYAQLELLAKKIYQSPNFYANAYDTPANIKRKKVALKAIEVMVDRAIYESQMRKEMLSSTLLSTRLQISFDDVQEKLGGVQ